MMTPNPFFLAAREASACALLFSIGFIMIVTVAPNTMRGRVGGYGFELLSPFTSLRAKNATVQEKASRWQNAIARQFGNDLHCALWQWCAQHRHRIQQ